MARASISQDQPVIMQPIRKIVEGHIPYLVTVLSAGLTLIVISSLPLTHDVAWQLWIARQILQGAEIYRDIWEVNPPLWFWSAMPVVHLGDMIGIEPPRLLIALICALAALSSMTVGRLSGVTGARQALLMLLGLLVMLIMPIYDFGQREQLALICGLPYAALIAQRAKSESIPSALVVLIGLMAAYGFALKHYFVIVPLLLEIWLYTRLRSFWRPLRIETVILAVSAVLYALSVLVFAPSFLKTVVPMIEIAYNGNIIDWHATLMRPWICFWIVAGAYFIVYNPRKEGGDGLVIALLITALGFCLGYFMQHKGWAYHSIATSGALCMALGSFIVRTRRLMPRLTGLLALTYTIFVPWKMGIYSNPATVESDPILNAIPVGEPVMSIAVDPRWLWPIIEKHNLLWSSRLYSYWMIPTLTQVRVDGPPSPEMERLGARIRSETVLEMHCMPPALVMFEKPRRYAIKPAQLDVRSYFLENEELRSFLADNYRELPPSKSFYLYRRTTSPKPLMSSECPRLSRDQYFRKSIG